MDVFPPPRLLFFFFFWVWCVGVWGGGRGGVGGGLVFKLLYWGYGWVGLSLFVIGWCCPPPAGFFFFFFSFCFLFFSLAFKLSLGRGSYIPSSPIPLSILYPCIHHLPETFPGPPKHHNIIPPPNRIYPPIPSSTTASPPQHSLFSSHVPSSPLPPAPAPQP